jgi:hypothetical protein
VNTIYSKVWSHARGAVVVASELASRMGKGRSAGSRVAASAVLLAGVALSPLAQACTGLNWPGSGLGATSDSLTCASLAATQGNLVGTDSVTTGPNTAVPDTTPYVLISGSSASGPVNATLGGYDDVAMGSGANTAGSYAVAVGSGANAATDYSLAMGYQANASGTSSLVVGASSTASGTNAIVLGDGSTASGNGSMVLGTGGQA